MAKAEAVQAWLTAMSSNVDIIVTVIDFGLLGGQAKEAHHGVWLQCFWEKSQGARDKVSVWSLSMGNGVGRPVRACSVCACAWSVHNHAVPI